MCLVEIENLVSTDDGARVTVRPIQTGHSSKKRNAALVDVAVNIAAGGISPATKSRNTDSMIADSRLCSKKGLKTKL